VGTPAGPCHGYLLSRATQWTARRYGVAAAAIDRAAVCSLSWVGTIGWCPIGAAAWPVTWRGLGESNSRGGLRTVAWRGVAGAPPRGGLPCLLRCAGGVHVRAPAGQAQPRTARGSGAPWRVARAWSARERRVSRRRGITRAAACHMLAWGAVVWRTYSRGGLANILAWPEGGRPAARGLVGCVVFRACVVYVCAVVVGWGCVWDGAGLIKAPPLLPTGDGLLSFFAGSSRFHIRTPAVPLVSLFVHNRQRTGAGKTPVRAVRPRLRHNPRRGHPVTKTFGGSVPPRPRSVPGVTLSAIT